MQVISLICLSVLRDICLRRGRFAYVRGHEQLFRLVRYCFTNDECDVMLVVVSEVSVLNTLLRNVMQENSLSSFEHF